MLGHAVRRMPPRYVKPYLERGKNDAADAEAICEAVQWPTMRFVPIKSPDQQSLLVVHRTRQWFVRQRTRLINAIRAHLAEFGIVAGVGRNGVKALLAIIADGEEDRLPSAGRDCLMALAAHVELVDRQIQAADRQVLAWHRQSEISRRLESHPRCRPARRHGPCRQRSRSRHVPLGARSQRLDRAGPEAELQRRQGEAGQYLEGRQPVSAEVVVVGALAVIKRARVLGYSRHPWLVRLMERQSAKIAAVTLANKIARMAWAMMLRGEHYRAQPLPAA